MDTKPCPWCAESIKAEAIKCRYCGSRLERSEAAMVAERDWHRGDPDRKLGGVCTALARNLDLPVVAVRGAFVVLGLFRGFGVLVYGLLWLMLPEGPGEKAPYEKVIGWAKSFLEEPPRRRSEGPLHRPGNGRDEELETDWR